MDAANLSLITSVITGVALILGTSDSIPTQSSKRSAYGGSFQSTATLVSDNAANRGTSQTSNDSASPCIGSRATGCAKAGTHHGGK